MATMAAVVLALLVFGCLGVAGWQATSSFNCYLLVAVVASLPTMVMVSLVTDGALSLHLCSLISPQEVKLAFNPKQFLRS